MSNNQATFNKPLKAILKLSYEIEVLTGLHIGGSKESIEIGGIDNIVIKTPYYEGKRNVPYIPGSSLKGKIRALLEWVEKPQNNPNLPIAISNNGEPCNCGKCNICKLFGTHKAGKNQTEPVRVRFDDFYPTMETIQMWEDVLEGLYTEIKTENTINRITGTAAHPRHQERVIPGSIFKGNIIIRLFEGDSYQNTLEILQKGIKLLENDYLGGSGSRGYGRVEIGEPKKAKIIDINGVEKEIEIEKLKDEIDKITKIGQ
ncbi:type III-A CRISPR-associated RAMP protein Csm3 [Venenivibrio stagnispumantis]|uniref:CRISPR system Cms endoribonuclease Csm3 n=1 Tax=Venenivibrio stagnispumantis TaxID=407998 RepID=A0AA46ADD6_9AQUI|nr:type III-A CRISPR-associated RAMP protein Csm3 [Venenivibrio stagnispumantis]MCW4572909.1 type III-A CRISPR-associated RAMP protein Csm3 [Venenivibrio stagnispumantis]SMP04321.1 CRISPR-associated protein, Csm3 family [Venenivibrio stagnispumantis]